MKTTHTPTQIFNVPSAYPWRVSNSSAFAILDGGGHLVASAHNVGYYSDAQNKARAALIVRAVNAHAELVAALETLLRETEWLRANFTKVNEVSANACGDYGTRLARAALAAARES